MGNQILRLPISLFLLGVMLLPGTACCGQRKETFSNDPKWDEKNNRVIPPYLNRVNQDFGWSPTSYSGLSKGEIGGEIWQSVRPAYYAKIIEPKTFGDPVSASGTLALLEAKAISGYHTSSNLFVGWFTSNEDSLLWRPKNFLGIFFGSSNEPDGAIIQISYGTSAWEAGGVYVDSLAGSGQERNPSELDSTRLLRIPPDGTRHKWSFRYDPSREEEKGQIIFSFDGVETHVRIPRSHISSGAKFDRFGIFPVRLPGRNMRIFFDDITLDSQFEDFTNNPDWEELGNRQAYIDEGQYGANNFGYSPTAHAGGLPGEMGGRIFSCNPDEDAFKGYYGDRIGNLTLEDQLIAHGRFATKRFSTDSSFALGWFNASEQGWPIKNFVGVYFDSLSDVGRIVQPLYGTSRGNQRPSEADFLTFLPDGTSYNWTLEYDPKGAEGKGAIRFTIGGKSMTLPLNEGDQSIGATFNRFGVFNLQGANSKWCEVYLDDLDYTAGD